MLLNGIIRSESYGCFEFVAAGFFELHGEAAIDPAEGLQLIEAVVHPQLLLIIHAVFIQHGTIEEEIVISVSEFVAYIEVVYILFYLYIFVSRQVSGTLNNLNGIVVLPAAVAAVRGEAIGHFADLAGHIAHMDIYAPAIIPVVVDIELSNGILGFGDKHRLIPSDLLAGMQVEILQIQVCIPEVGLLAAVGKYGFALLILLQICIRVVNYDLNGISHLIVVYTYRYGECIATGLIEHYAEAGGAVFVANPAKAVMIGNCAGRIAYSELGCAFGELAALSEVVIREVIDEFLAALCVVDIRFDPQTNLIFKVLGHFDQINGNGLLEYLVNYLSLILIPPGGNCPYYIGRFAIDRAAVFVEALLRGEHCLIAVVVLVAALNVQIDRGIVLSRFDY